MGISMDTISTERKHACAHVCGMHGQHGMQKCKVRTVGKAKRASTLAALIVHTLVVGVAHNNPADGVGATGPANKDNELASRSSVQC
jgi:hypothetical protein